MLYKMKIELPKFRRVRKREKTTLTSGERLFVFSAGGGDYVRRKKERKSFAGFDSKTTYMLRFPEKSYTQILRTEAGRHSNQ
jgi:hypothetical protein